MQPDIAMFDKGAKFMWDGALYETRESAEAAQCEYEGSAFETRLVEEQGAFLVYSRRVVTEIVLEGEAPLG
jgi:hypothetical protein